MELRERICWYFADPMCSWCWGFAPVVSAIRETFGERLRVALVLGGLRPGTRETLSPALREEILHHWGEVHRRTGQPFAFEGALPDGFVYDTEPPSRAVIAVGALAPETVFPYFRSVQHAFYAEQKDVTRSETLAALAERQGIEAASFLDRFESEEVKRATRMHFARTRRAGIGGFPTVVLQDETGYRLLTHGYLPWVEIEPAVDAWLDGR